MTRQDTPEDPAQADLLTVAETIAALRTTRSTLNRWMKAGRITGRKVGRQWRFSREEIDRVLSGEAPPVDPPVGLTELGERLLARFREAAGRDFREAAGRGRPPVEDLDTLVDLLIELSVELRASDLHIDPRGHADPEVEVAELSVEAVIRLRIDGVLHPIAVFDIRLLPPLVTHLKARAGGDVRERTLPQDGRIITRMSAGEGDERFFDLRVCFLPAALGECVTMRIFDQSKLFFSLERIGLVGEDLERTRSALASPHGLIVVTGPTGSGKTTTHYSCLSEIVGPERKFMSLEDPVEFHLPGVVQVPIRADAGMTFPTAFRHLMRCDPDVILVGEIRDLDTLQICCRASLTGHLIQTTLHTESAVAALGRMLDLGIAPFLLAEAVSFILAQRIVRMVCPDCGEPDAPTDILLERAERIAVAGGLDWSELPREYRRPVGCARCAGGYRGRVGIYESLVVTTEIREAIREGAPIDEMRALALSQGMTTLEADGIRKATVGRTTIEEVVRVLRPGAD